MNEQNEMTINPMQATEACPLEETCLPADVVIAGQQSDARDEAGPVPLFVP